MEQENLFEKAHSRKQQRLMGAVYHYKSLPKSEREEYLNSLSASFAKKIKEIADGSVSHSTKGGTKTRKGISKSDAEDFASTKHKGLPEKVKEHIITNFEDFVNENYNQ